MTWRLIDVDIQTRVVTPQELQRGVLPGLGNLVRTVVGTFDDFDANGVAKGTQHVYAEPNVSDCSPPAIAKLMRDHETQLNRIQNVSVGKLSSTDLDGLRALMSGPRLAPDEIAAIRAVADFTQSDAAIADALNAETIDNPAPRGLVQPAFNVTTLLGSLSNLAKKSLAANPNTATIRDDARRIDGPAMCNWAALLLKDDQIDQADFDLIMATCRPVADSAWKARVSRAVSILGRDATASDIAVARASV